MVDLSTLTQESVEAHITDECKDLPDSTVLQKLESAKNMVKSTKVEATRASYMIGKEISKSQLDSLIENYKDMMAKYPAEEIPVSKPVWNDEHKAWETKITYKYRNPTPVGSTGSPLEALSHLEVLTNFAQIPDEDKAKLAELRERLNTATTLTDYKDAQKNLALEETRLISDLRIPAQLYVLKTNLTEYKVSEAEHKWDKAQHKLRFAQFKVLGYQAEMSRRATEAKRLRVIDRAASFMNTTGVEMVGKFL
ncbi:hypothetical protein [Bacteroides sp.]|uniref:hypothetical protein n=1 Tax=Bacteroides sp. TaxID=29523 RepID=UPI0026122C3C|nr:hypothetical protein [Bacteroides sp.]MDD3039552.1 hypothetical protein [Bacteroides sp.]